MPPPPSLKALSKAAFGLFLVFLFVILINPANSAFQCVICPENHYCTNGEKYECPANRPVTDGGQKASDSDCITCFAKTGNSATAGFKDGICTDCFSANSSTPVWGGEELGCTTCFAARGESTPVYSDQEGDCVTCAQATANAQPIWDFSSKSCVSCGDDTPFWNGRQCAPCEDGYYQEEIVCPEGTEWNGSECVSTALVVVPTDTGTFRIMEVFDPTPVSYETCLAMAKSSNYPDVTECYDWDADPDEWGTAGGGDQDYWAGAYKYCVDKGMRLPTMQELAYVARVVYGDTSIDAYTDNYNITVADNDLFNLLSNNDSSVYLWSSEQVASTPASLRFFAESGSESYDYYRYTNDLRAFCLGD